MFVINEFLIDNYLFYSIIENNVIKYRRDSDKIINMKIYVYIDESGSIHKNSKTRYFAVGGYFTFFEGKNKIISLYKKFNKKIKDKRKIDLKKEIKSYDMTDDEKINIFNEIKEVKDFCGIAKVFDKKLMNKEIVESNIFFNYAVKLLFSDCIIPLIDLKKINEKIEFIVSVDTRNIKVRDLKNLEDYLKTEFCLSNFNFKVTYYDSQTNYGIQLADLIVNTFYNIFKNRSIVQKVIPVLKKEKFRLSIFPGYKIKGRTNKIE